MEIEWFVKAGSLILLLMGSAFFSGSEVALFSLDKKKLESDNAIDESAVSRYLKSLVQFPRRLLVTILIGNTLVNVGASIIGVSIAIDLATRYNLSLDIVVGLQILLLTLLVLLFGELLPKIIASKHPLKFARTVAIPLYLISVVIYPAAELITELLKLSSKKISFDKSKSALNKEELVELSNIGKNKGTIEEDEHSLISSIVNFSELSASEVMTPRVDMVAIAESVSYEQVVKIITESGHSRIPVYKNNLDEITGVIFAKDLLPYLKNPEAKKNFSVKDILKKTLFVPETKPINSLLKEFQKEKIHLAILVDEYGGTVGLITLEDIIEQVVGDIWDEFDDEESEIQKISQNKYIVLGQTKINDIDNELNLNLYSEDEDFDTIAGYILHKAGALPVEGYKINLDEATMTVKEIQRKKIKKILLELTPKPKTENI